MNGRGRERRHKRTREDRGRDPLAERQCVTTALEHLAALLADMSHPRADEVADLRRRFDADPATAWRTLNGNAWWAGAGSLAAETMGDNPGLDPYAWQVRVREWRELMIELGEVLRDRGEPNPGLGSWLLAFRSWNDSAV